MPQRHAKILPDIDDQLSLNARTYFRDLIHNYERRIAKLTKRIEQLETQVIKLTPQNSSVPPSTEHPHGKPDPKP